MSEPLRTIAMHAQLLERRIGSELTGDNLESFQYLIQSARRNAFTVAISTSGSTGSTM